MILKRGFTWLGLGWLTLFEQNSVHGQSTLHRRLVAMLAQQTCDAVYSFDGLYLERSRSCPHFRVAWMFCRLCK